MHPSDSTLLALVHGELSRAATAELRVHLDGCGDCARAAEQVGAADREIAVLLSALDHPVPAIRYPLSRGGAPSMVRRAAIAAALTLVAAGAAVAAVPAARAWLRSRLTPRPVVEAPVPAPRQGRDTPAPVGGVVVTAGSTLVIGFRQPQPAGTLAVAPAPGDKATLQSDGGAVAYEVGEGRIEVDNRRPADRYTLAIPDAVRSLTVRVGGETIFHAAGDALAAAQPPIPLHAPERDRTR